MGYGGGLASRWMGIPIVLEVNGDHLPEMEMLGKAPQGAQLWVSTILTKSAVNQASVVVAAGEGWRKKFIERWQVNSNIVTTIENGSTLVEQMTREQLRSFRNVEEENEVVKIVYVGAFEPWHGIPVLLKAAAMAINQGVCLHIALIGSGSELERIEKLVSELNLETHVTLTGFLAPEDYLSFLAKAHLAVSPYCGRVEYSGLKLLDYKAAGLATIASGMAGEPKVIDHGRTGWIVPPCDAAALCEAIVLLAKDRELRTNLGRVARIEAETEHSWQNTVVQLSNLFENLVFASSE